MNISTLIGIIVGLAVICTAMFTSAGGASVFWNPGGLAIVLGGVISATFVCYPLKDVMHFFKSVLKVLRREHLPIEDYIDNIVRLSKQSIAKGSIKFEKVLKATDNFFIQDGLRMLSDHYPEDRIRHIMEITIINTVAQEKSEAEIFKTMARFCPAFGMVGTLMGLVVTFQNLQSNPETIGTSIGVAMMSTLYGLLFANLIFTPFAIKMEGRAKEREVLMNVILEGLIMVSKSTPPEYVRDELRSFIPTRTWSEKTIKKSSKGKTVKKSST